MIFNIFVISQARGRMGVGCKEGVAEVEETVDGDAGKKLGE